MQPAWCWTHARSTDTIAQRVAVYGFCNWQQHSRPLLTFAHLTDPPLSSISVRIQVRYKAPAWASLEKTAPTAIQMH